MNQINPKKNAHNQREKKGSSDQMFKPEAGLPVVNCGLA